MKPGGSRAGVEDSDGGGMATGVLLSHPTGNPNVRQALAALYEHDLLAEFWTTIRWDPAWALNAMLPGTLSRELNRRSYPQLPPNRVKTRPWREAARLLAMRAGMASLTRRNESFLSVASVYYGLDRAVAARVGRGGVNAVYAYEDGALETFRAARRHGIRTIYELPTTYWKAWHDLLAEEAELMPEWADTMGMGRDSTEKTARKDAELELSDLIIVPTRYVADNLPEPLRGSARVQVCPYGAPAAIAQRSSRRHSKLRVLYVGNLSQRKGMAYLLRALAQVEPLVELTLIGSRAGSCAELEAALARYRYIPSMPHAQVLEEMERQDVLVFPSLAEGFGLVILEAMSRGMPVITTRNTGGPEVMEDGREGFFVPIRSSEAIAEKLELLATDRALLEAMSEAALARARECTWERYRGLLVSKLQGNGTVS